MATTKQPLSGSRTARHGAHRTKIVLPVISSPSNRTSSRVPGGFSNRYLDPRIATSASSKSLPPQILQLIFSDGTSSQKDIREETRAICKQLNIDPSSLQQKERKEFEEEGVPDRIQDIRFNHYVQRRQKHLEIIEQAIISGGHRAAPVSTGSPMKSRQTYSPKLKIPENMKAAERFHSNLNQSPSKQQMSPVKQQSQANLLKDRRSSFMKSTGGPQSHNRRTSNMGVSTNMNKSMGSRDELQMTMRKKQKRQRIQTSSEIPGFTERMLDHNNVSVPLRVPLDLDYSNGNRKLANSIFKSELVQKVKEYQIQKQINLEHQKAGIIAKQVKDEARFAKEIKARNLEIKKRNQEYESQRKMVNENKRKMNYYKEMELREKQQELIEADKKHKEELSKRKKEHEEELFHLDLQRAYDEEMASGAHKTKLMKDQREVEKGIKKFRDKFERNQTAREKGLEQLKMKIQAQNKVREERQFIAQNKDSIIPETEYRKFIPKKVAEHLASPVLTPKAAATGRNQQVQTPKPAEAQQVKSQSPPKKNADTLEGLKLMKTGKGVLVQKTAYLSNFTIDKDKIEFYQKAKALADKMQKSEKNRQALMAKQKTNLSRKMAEKFQQAKINKKAIVEEQNYKLQELKEKLSKEV